MCVRILKGQADLAGDLYGVRIWHRHQLPQRSPRHILHDNQAGIAVFDDVVDSNDIRMGKLRGGLRLAEEPLEPTVPDEMRGKRLDCDRSIEGGVIRFEDNTHPALSELLFKAVTLGDHIPCVHATTCFHAAGSEGRAH